MPERDQKNISTIPAGYPFARTLARKLYQDTLEKPDRLVNMQIILPTRRACRVLQDAFLNESSGKPLLLPRLSTLGDVDEDALSFSIISQMQGNTDPAAQEWMDSVLNMPLAIQHIQRQLMLAKLIMALPDFSQGTDHAMVMAKALGRFMDHVYTESLNLSDLKNLVPEQERELQEHWEITLEFLKILSANWPDILKERQVIDYADRRNRLILSLAEFWTRCPPDFPVIAAGTTGSIPAVAELLSVVASLPNGEVILPGYDHAIDQDSWNAMDETHPQYGFKKLFEIMNIERGMVGVFEMQAQDTAVQLRQTLGREIMRPADTTSEWTHFATNKTMRKDIEAASKDLHYLPCKDEYDEALVVSLLLREVLEEDKKTAILITPDRNLAKRVKSICGRWDIKLDDTAGEPLSQSGIGGLFLLVAEACLSHLAPVPLLALLKHDDCAILDAREISLLEKYILRGAKPRAGVEGVRKRVSTLKEEGKADLTVIVDKIDSVFSSLLDVVHQSQNFEMILQAHLTCFHAIISQKENISIEAEAQEQLGNLLSDLFVHASEFPATDGETYIDIMRNFLKEEVVRPRFGTHPRLKILGQLEARLIDADRVIMAGLNEGIWPSDPPVDPWMSRPMRKAFGLPAHERSIGLSAHDFIQGFCGKEVFLTRAERMDGAPTLPARWIQRMETVYKAAGLSFHDLTRFDASKYSFWAEELDKPENFTPISERPAPRPPVEVRPRKLSATRIRDLMQDPYGIYARYILNLRKIDPLEKAADAALRGNVLHDVLENFVKTYPRDLPENARETLDIYLEEEFKKYDYDESVWQFWRARYAQNLDWYVEQETSWRQSTKNLNTEIEGQTTLKGPEGDFIVTAIIDRIDQGHSGAIVIDYKTGAAPTAKAVKGGYAPQLPIEGLIIANKGYQGVETRIVQEMAYWVMGGGSSADKVVSFTEDIDGLLEQTKANLLELIQVFDDPQTPYFSVPDIDNMPRYSDYTHLSRIKEWSAAAEGEGDDG